MAFKKHSVSSSTISQKAVELVCAKSHSLCPTNNQYTKHCLKRAKVHKCQYKGIAAKNSFPELRVKKYFEKCIDFTRN